MYKLYVSYVLYVSSVLYSGCSFTFDGSPRPLPLDQQHAIDPLQRLSKPSDYAASYVIGPDGVAWIAFYAASSVGVIGQVKMQRLAEPYQTVAYQAEMQLVSSHGIYYRLHDGANDVSPLMFARPGEPAVELPTPNYPGTLSPSDNDRAVAYLPTTDKPQTFTVMRTDGSFHREIPRQRGWPPLFSGDGEWIFTFDSSGISAYTTASSVEARLPTALEIDRVDAAAIVDDARHQLVLCDGAGLRTVAFDGSSWKRLDSDVCGVLAAGVEGPPVPLIAGDAILYHTPNGYKLAAADGSRRPIGPLTDDHRLLAWSGTELAYSNDPRLRWSGEAGDGWIGGWRFMERGLAVAFGRAGALRFLEHAADDEGAGELTAIDPSGARVLEALNVTQFDELSDGRVIAIADRAFDGQQNRLIVVDEQAGRARVLAEGFSRYTLIPGADAVLAEPFNNSDVRYRFVVPERAR